MTVTRHTAICITLKLAHKTWALPKTNQKFWMWAFKIIIFIGVRVAGLGFAADRRTKKRCFGFESKVLAVPDLVGWRAFGALQQPIGLCAFFYFGFVTFELDITDVGERSTDVGLPFGIADCTSLHRKIRKLYSTLYYSMLFDIMAFFSHLKASME